MSTIDLIVLGILRKDSLSAYDIQKQVEYRSISQWVKISTPSIYKKVLQLEEKGFIRSQMIREGKMPEKAVHSLTDAGEMEFERLMLIISDKPVNIFLDFNAVIVNLDSLPPDKRSFCLDNIEHQVTILRSHLEENIHQKDYISKIPQTAIAILQQQYILAQTIEAWITKMREQNSSVKKELPHSS